MRLLSGIAIFGPGPISVSRLGGSLSLLLNV